MAHVTLQNVYKVFQGSKGKSNSVVEDFTLDVADKEFLVLVGPSGCGKSTTLRMIAGLEELSGGTLSIDGTIVNEVPPKDRDVAMVFQNYALYPHMTAYGNMAFGLTLRKYAKKEIRQRVNEAAELLGLTEEMLERKPRDLSGGQRQRVAVGRAIVRKPKVFLFDEPLSNLDAKLRAQMRADIINVHRRLGATMVYVTHDQVEAMTMGDRIAIMSRGRIQQIAKPMEIYHLPANMFVAGFIGNPPMNFLEGQLIKREGKLFFHELNGQGGPGAVLIALTLAQTEKLLPLVNQKIVLGSRPEHLQILPTESLGGSENVLRAKVEAIEPMGAENQLRLNTAIHPLTIRTPAEVPIKAGQFLELSISMEKAHFFHSANKEPFMRNPGHELDQEAWQSACPRIS